MRGFYANENSLFFGHLKLLLFQMVNSSHFELLERRFNKLEGNYKHFTDTVSNGLIDNGIRIRYGTLKLV